MLLGSIDFVLDLESTYLKLLIYVCICRVTHVFTKMILSIMIVVRLLFLTSYISDNMQSECNRVLCVKLSIWVILKSTVTEIVALVTLGFTNDRLYVINSTDK